MPLSRNTVKDRMILKTACTPRA